MTQPHLEGLLVAILFIGYVALWKYRKIKMMQATQHDPEVIYADNRPTQKFFANLARVLSMAMVLLILLHIADPGRILSLAPMKFVDNGPFKGFGFLLGLAGLRLCWKAQQFMGASWRVGIDRKQKTALVTGGPFQRIRNPTYSGLFMLVLGAFIIIPTMAVFLWVVVFYISIEFQVRIEEEFLTEIHGEEYIRYFQGTRRYIPFRY